MRRREFITDWSVPRRGRWRRGLSRRRYELASSECCTRDRLRR